MSSRPRPFGGRARVAAGAYDSSMARGIAEAARELPEATEAPGVLACGYASEKSFGAASWLVVRKEGNVLVDSPRFARPLAERIRALGGIRIMFLTHRDDVADHALWREAFGCERVLHGRDVAASTADVERILDGRVEQPLAADLLAVPVPGHTPGSMALLVGQSALFTGDHLWGDAAGHLDASREVCWYDWDEQRRSMERLARLPFRWVFLGHGRPWQAATPEAAQAAVASLAQAMRR